MEEELDDMDGSPMPLFTWVRNIDIPAGVTDISDNCFNGCAIARITLPAHMKSIGVLAFATNDNLATVNMPQTLLSLGDKAFSWCTALTAIAIPDSLRIIPREAFNSCPRLASITWGNAVEEIGHAAFWAMAASHIDLPPTLKKLDNLAFAACDNNLRTVTVHSQLDTMGEAIFRHASLNRIRFTVATPPITTEEGPLYEIGRLDSIVIPCGSLDTWLADSYWGQFADKYIEDCDGIEDISDDRLIIRMHGLDLQIEGAEGDTVRLLDIMGRTLYTGSSSCLTLPSPGIYLLQVGHRPARKVVGW